MTFSKQLEQTVQHCNLLVRIKTQIQHTIDQGLPARLTSILFIKNVYFVFWNPYGIAYIYNISVFSYTPT